jgi:hypothetical protein
MFGMNDFALESTFRLKGNIGLGGNQSIALETMQAANDSPIPAPLALAGWVGSKFQKLFTNSGEFPAFESVNVTIELLPERRLAVIEQAAVDSREVAPGDVVKGKAILRPYRGPRIIEPFELTVPPNAQKGPLRLLVTDAATLDRNRQAAVDRNHLLSLNETVSALNREPANNRLYVTLMQPAVTAHVGDKSLPNVPLSVLNVMRNSSPGRLALEPQSVLAQTSMDLHSIVSGSHSITLQVK